MAKKKKVKAKKKVQKLGAYLFGGLTQKALREKNKRERYLKNL